MGGSGIGGNFVASFAESSCSVPIMSLKDYSVPQWANEHTLAIVSSYSGNTEETLAAFATLLERGSKVVCISSGGQLIKAAGKKDWTTFNYQEVGLLREHVWAFR